MSTNTPSSWTGERVNVRLYESTSPHNPPRLAAPSRGRHRQFARERRWPLPILLIAALGVVAVLLLACTTDTKASEASVKVAPAPAPYTVVMATAPSPVAATSRHSAFPGLAQAADGTLNLVWRGGTDHAASRDGSIYRATSTDQGRTWSAAKTVLSGGHDYRDPSLAIIDGHEYLTYFTGSSGLPAEGAYVTRDGGPPVRIDWCEAGIRCPYAAISAPVVKLPDGRLATPFYAKKAGESVVTSWMAWSTDLGATWTTNRILNDGVDHAEPVLVVRNGVTHLIARGGADTLVMRSSTNSGAPGSWDTPHVIVGACTGRPSALVTAAGTMIVVCRGILPSPNAQLAYSVDPTGAKWWWGPTLGPAPAGSFGMTYAAMVEVLPGVVLEVGAMEQADGSSSLSRTWLAEAVQ